MAAKSIVQIDVDDEAFKRFKAIFEKYQDGLKAMPGQWAAAGAASSAAAAATKEGFVTQAEGVAAISVALAAMVKHQGDSERVARSSGSMFKQMAQSTSTIATNVANTTFQLLKWVALGGALGAATGFFGAGALAANVAGQRREAGNLRVTPGQLNAARIQFGNYFNPEQALGAIGNAQFDATKRAALLQAGFTSDEIMKGDVGDLLPKVMSAMVRRVAALGGTQQAFDAAGAGDYMTFQEYQRMRMHPAEMTARAKDYARDSVTLNQSDRTQSTLASLSRTFEEAETRIKNIFGDKLAELAPNIEHLSQSLVNAFSAIMNSPHMGEWIEDFGHGIEWLAKTIGAEDFKADIQSLVDGLHKLAHPLDTAVNFAQNVDVESGVKGQWWNPIWQGQQELKGLSWLGGKAADLFGSTGVRSTLSGLMGGGVNATLTHEDFLKATEQGLNLPAGTLDTLWYLESDRGRLNHKSSAGALGNFQQMPDMLAHYGVKLGDWNSEAAGATAQFMDEARRYKFDMAKAFAAYNLGDTKLDAILKAHPKDYARYLPQETYDYVKKSGTYPNMPDRVDLHVHHRPGSDVIVQANSVGVAR